MNYKKVCDYRHLADNYDEIRYSTESAKFIDSLREEAFAHLLNPNKKMKLIDVGTGTGSGTIFFAKRVKDMVGLDLTQKMLSHAQKKINRNNINNAKLICSNALEIPFKDDSFDNVISLNFVHLFVPQGISKQKEFISEMERIVKKNGNVIVEFDNVMYARELGNSYKDLFKMSNKMNVDKIIGTYLPKTKWLIYLNKTLAGYYARLSWYYPFKIFAYKWVVKFVKL